ncbi:VanZ family protein [Pontimicrobium sp. SW4]|uniref:VanZ family protein n=1 Tax=Pontimicrobium sp. SW4 TaxID=3153519 RepID=A0AAU7BQX3_9FLAO
MLNKRVFLFLAVVYTIALATICLIRNDGLPYFGTNYEDKIYHLIAYGIFCFLWYKVLNNQKVKYAIAIAFAISIVYGTIIEVLQGQLTTTRDASIADIAANIVGATIISLILTIRNKTIVKNI